MGSTYVQFHNWRRDVMNDFNTVFVYKVSLARKLLHEGYKLVDIFPRRRLDGTTDYTRCTFAFENKNDIKQKISDLLGNSK